MDSIHKANQQAIEQRKALIPDVERIINHEMTVWQQNQRRNAFVAPRLHNIDTLLSEIAQNELQRIENKVDEKPLV